MERRTAAALDEWAGRGRLSPSRSERLVQLVMEAARRERRRRVARLGAVAVCLAALLLLLTSSLPAVSAWASERFPAVAHFIGRWSRENRGWAWANKHGMFQEVMAARTDKGITLRVHRVLADAYRTTVVYTVEGASGGPAAQEMEFRLNGKEFVNAWSVDEEMIDGGVVGTIEMNGLPEETGALRLQIPEIGGVRGRWDVSFPVSRAAMDAMTRVVPVLQTIKLPRGELVVERLSLTPTQTVVQMRSSGVRLDVDRLSLVLPDGREMERFFGLSRGRSQLIGKRVTEHEFSFDRLEPVPDRVVLRVSGRVYLAGETRIPLETGTVIQAPDGRPVTLGEAGPGRAVITYPVDESALSPFDAAAWQVVDDTGALHRVRPEGSTLVQPAAGSTERLERQGINWQVPKGRTAVALHSPGYWANGELLGEVEIEIGPAIRP